MNKIRISFGAILIASALFALFRFEQLQSIFFVLSPDGSVTPYMWLLLRMMVLSFSVVGALLLFWEPLFKLLEQLDIILNRQTLTQFLLVMIGSGFLLRLLSLVLLPLSLWGDYGCYDDLARQWFEKGDYYNGELLTAYWPPGYPYFLSRLYLIFGDSPTVGAIANLFLGMMIPLLTYFIVRKIWTESIARWTMLIIVLFPSQVFFTNLLASEMIFMPLLLGMILIVVTFNENIKQHHLYLFAAGILLGLATLTRSIGKFYIFLPSLSVLLCSKKYLRSGILLLLLTIGFSLPVVPWMIRNIDAVGEATINTNSGVNLYMGNQPSSGMGYNAPVGSEFDVNDPALEVWIDSVTWARGIDYIVAEPMAFVKRGILKLGFFYATDVDAFEVGIKKAADADQFNYFLPLAFIAQSYWFIICLLALLGFLFHFVRDAQFRNSGGWLLLLTIIYWSSIHFVFYGNGRYHFPIVPMLSAFAALFIVGRLKCQRECAIGKDKSISGQRDQ